MPERKTLNEDLFYKGSSANLPRLHTCENIKSRFGILKNLPSQLGSLSNYLGEKCERPYLLSYGFFAKIFLALSEMVIIV